MTRAELALWERIKGGQIGVHFSPQIIIRGWIVDFYCGKELIVIEVDGDSHNEKQAQDARRDRAMEEMGFLIVRVSNDEIFNSIDKFLERWIPVFLARKRNRITKFLELNDSLFGVDLMP